MWQQKLIRWLGEEEEEEEEKEELYLDWTSDSLSPYGRLSESEEAEVGTCWGPGLLREEWRGGACSCCRSAHRAPRIRP